MNTPPHPWHAITFHTCGEVLTSGLLPPGCGATDLYSYAFQAAHRQVDGCPATDVVLAPCTAEEVEARLRADIDAGRAL